MTLPKPLNKADFLISDYPMWTTSASLPSYSPHTGVGEKSLKKMSLGLTPSPVTSLEASPSKANCASNTKGLNPCLFMSLYLDCAAQGADIAYVSAASETVEERLLWGDISVILFSGNEEVEIRATVTIRGIVPILKRNSASSLVSSSRHARFHANASDPRNH